MQHLPSRRARLLGAALLIAASLPAAGCFVLRPSRGGGETTLEGDPPLGPDAIALPDGYRIDRIASDLTFPTAIVFDDAGTAYVLESGYSYGEVWTVPRLLRLETDGSLAEVAKGGDNGPWTGATWGNGHFYVAEGGRKQGGKILRIGRDGKMEALVEGLPSKGDHAVNGPVLGADGFLYFTVGTATNSGVVGADNVGFGWVKDHPDFHDVPCEDLVLNGVNISTPNPLAEGGTEVETGAFVPFGTRTEKGQKIPGAVPCSGSVLKMRPEPGAPVELVAWGFRNPFGIAFAPDGKLFVTDNAYDDRGSRPVHGAGDLLWAVRPGTWYGWPDFHGARMLDYGDHYDPPGRSAPEMLLAAHPNVPPEPTAILAVHSSTNGFDFSTNEDFGFVGQAFLAQFGDMAPAVGKVMAPVGYKVIRIDLKTGLSEDFAVNRGRTNGPASWLRMPGLERPVQARFDREGKALYVVDFGVLLQKEEKSHPQRGTGSIWRITRDPRALPGPLAVSPTGVAP